MGNKLRVSFIFTSFFTFLLSIANAKLPQIPAHQDDSKTPSGKICSNKFGDLDYVGLRFSGKAVCVDASTDAEALTACGGVGRVINPGNPQYIENPHPDATSGKNPDGYYYCVPNIPQNRKQYACQNIAPTSSPYKEKYPDIQFTWVQTSPRDGDCLCSVKGSNKKAFKCNQESELVANMPSHPCTDAGLNIVSVDEYQTLSPDMHCDSCEVACKCDDGRFFSISEAKTKCKQPDVAKTPAKDPPKPTKPDDKLVACVQALKNKAEICKKDADGAVQSCDATNTMTKDQAQNVKDVEMVKQQFIKMNQNTGNISECFGAAVVANKAQDEIKTNNDKCVSSSDKCSSSCSQTDFDKAEEDCRKLIAENEHNEYNEKYFNDNIQNIKSTISVGQKVCSEDSKKGKLELGKALSTIGNSLKSAVACMCNFSGGSAANCNNIPTRNQCYGSLDVAGCGVYGGLDVCTPGANYNQKLCMCQTTVSAGCPGHLSGNLANFTSGTNFNDSTTPANFNSGGLLAGNLKGSDVDLSSLVGDGGATNKMEFPDDSSSASSAGSAGGLGGGLDGGSVGGGNSAKPTASAEPTKEKGILDMGLLDKARNFFARGSKGGSGKANGNLKGTSASGSGNPNLFKPLRGIASRTGMGTKNQDIWSMMNRCFTGETCSGNSNGFLEDALKHK